MSYGRKPEVIANHKLYANEMMLYLQMPIWMPFQPGSGDIDMIDLIPKRLKVFVPLIAEATGDSFGRGERFDYWYITAKCMYVTPQSMGNRPGWHADGYGTDDINYIWCDAAPTEFAVQEFLNLSADHSVSLVQMEDQASNDCIITFQPNDLIRLDQYNIHRVSNKDYTGVRAFFKLTGSNSKFNLIGNSRNYLMDYDWPMVGRSAERNMESAT